MITTLIVLVFTLLGLIVGSFLNVVICRLGTNKGFGGRSFCMSCSQRIAWHDLVPVLSYVCLLGRCRHCKSRISAQYPLVEMATGIVFGLLSLKFMGLFFYDTMYFIASYAFYAAMFCLLVVITAYDIRHKIIPDALLFIYSLEFLLRKHGSSAP